MVRIKCKKCLNIIVDTKKNISNGSIYVEYTLVPSEIGMNLELVPTAKYIVCNFCGNKISFDLLFERLKNENVIKKIEEVVKSGNPSF